ncbi:MAG: hypothetical protein CMN76_06320 [Spirochaetaceae bacterium]|nr:hypothetical protein [Spirochaetaceae bacterium]
MITRISSFWFLRALWDSLSLYEQLPYRKTRNLISIGDPRQLDPTTEIVQLQRTTSYFRKTVFCHSYITFLAASLNERRKELRFDFASARNR